MYTSELHRGRINEWARSESEQVTLEFRLIIEFDCERERERERMQGKKIANFAIETLSTLAGRKDRRRSRK